MADKVTKKTPEELREEADRLEKEESEEEKAKKRSNLLGHLLSGCLVISFIVFMLMCLPTLISAQPSVYFSPLNTRFLAVMWHNLYYNVITRAVAIVLFAVCAYALWSVLKGEHPKNQGHTKPSQNGK